MVEEISAPRYTHLDFFGDGPRIRLLVVSPHAKNGHVDHVYNDYVSILKFIECNRRLRPLSSRSRDRLPNPVMDDDDRYRPKNAPAISDLMTCSISNTVRTETAARRTRTPTTSRVSRHFQFEG